ncbi:hypothetical protein ZEAMMB73_Zm00001d027789 [Zea mays]|nr:hypothetical protein ZEAMMB73_Zm00001d027789 [Zea mays]
MEQQTISIAKAAITIVLILGTSVLAAVNPIAGCYDALKFPRGRNIVGCRSQGTPDILSVLCIVICQKLIGDYDRVSLPTKHPQNLIISSEKAKSIVQDITKVRLENSLV